MNSSESNLSLSQALADIVLPGVQRFGMEKIFVAAPRWKPNLELPEGMHLTRRELLDKPVAARGRRAYGASAVVDARWPRDKMYSARTPKLYFVLSGAMALNMADYVVHGKPGHGLLAPPGTPFSDGVDSCIDEREHNRCEMLMLLPYREGLICWISRRWHDKNGQLHKNQEAVSIPHSQVSFYVERLNAEATSDNLHRRKICDGLLNVTLALLHRELQELPVIRAGKTEGTNASPLAHGEHSLSQAEEYIRLNLRESLSIDKVARHLCLSRTTFTAQFRAATGKSFAQYVADLRFAEAERLLRESDLSIRHICALVGLKPCRLRALFQQGRGISPTQFRRENQGRDLPENRNGNTGKQRRNISVIE